MSVLRVVIAVTMVAALPRSSYGLTCQQAFTTISVPALSSAAGIALCPAGTVALGGGYSYGVPIAAGAKGSVAYFTVPYGSQGWQVGVTNRDATGPAQASIGAVCCSAPAPVCTTSVTTFSMASFMGS